LSIWEVLIIIIFYFVVKYLAALIFWGVAFKLITINIKKGAEEIGTKIGMSDMQGDGRPEGNKNAPKQRPVPANGEEKSKATSGAAG
jgi:hypothetical protein